MTVLCCIIRHLPMNSAKELLIYNKQEVMFYEAGNHQFYRSRKRFEHSFIQSAFKIPACSLPQINWQMKLSPLMGMI